MKLLRLSRRRILRLILAIPVAPLILWTIVLCLAPTNWARQKLIGELEAFTGRNVSIGSIRLGPLGNLRIRNVQFAETLTTDDPWMSVNEARLDLNLMQILMGCCKTTDVAVDGLDLRVHRRADGSLEFSDLLATDSKSKLPDVSVSAPSSRSGMRFSLKGSRIVVIDDRSSTRIELTDAIGSGTCAGTLITVSSLKGRLNGGSFEFAAKYDRVPSAPAFEAELRTRGVSMTTGTKSLGQLMPLISDSAGSLDSRVDLELALHAQCDLRTLNPADLKGHGAIRLKPIDLSRSRLLDSLEALGQVATSSRIGAVESDFAIDGGRIITDDLTLSVSSLPVILAGWTDFDGRINYRVKSEAINERISGKLPPEARAILGDLKQELGDLTDIRINGNVKDPQLMVGNRPFIGNGPAREETKARLREAAKKLSGKYLR